MLEREIIRRIFLNFGYISNSELGKYGLSTPDFIRPEKITGIYQEGDNFAFPIHGGNIEIENNQYIQCLMVDLTDQDVVEFAGIIIAQNNIYGLRLTYDDQDQGQFLLWDNKSWKPLSMYWKAKILSGTELIVFHGLLWKPLEKTPYIEQLTKLLEI